MSRLDLGLKRNPAKAKSPTSSIYSGLRRHEEDEASQIFFRGSFPAKLTVDCAPGTEWKWFETNNLQLRNMLSKSIYKTHYDILGVREGADHEEIRTSYRSAILDSHPDKLQKASETSLADRELGNRFLEVQRAWEILSNSKSRAAYDCELQALRQDFVTAEDVRFEDLMVETTGDVLELFYQCRCGDFFCIDSSELEEMGYKLLRNGSEISLQASDALPSSIILSCGSCSLQIRLSINAETKL